MMSLKHLVLFLVLVVLSVSISVFKPGIHKPIKIEDADFAFVQNSEVQEAVPVEILPTKKETGPKTLSVPSSATPKKTETPQKTVKSSTVQPKAANKPVKPVKTTKNDEVKVITTPEKTTPEPKSFQSSKVKRELTEEEEIIVWNKWRSDLQNQVLRDTKIGAPLGTVFKFSFTVDKFGKIYNLRVWSTSSAYSELAVKVIKPVLMSYQGKPILSFPDGTKRVITNVSGGFRVADYTKYSTPDDYSDIERVKKLR